MPADSRWRARWGGSATGQGYTGIEHDLDSAGNKTLDKVTGVVGQSYMGVDHLYNASHVFYEEIVHNTDGSNLIKAEIAGQNIPSTAADDTIHSFGTGDLFYESGASGHDQISGCNIAGCREMPDMRRVGFYAPPAPWLNQVERCRCGAVF